MSGVKKPSLRNRSNEVNAHKSTKKELSDLYFLNSCNLFYLLLIQLAEVLHMVY